MADTKKGNPDGAGAGAGRRRERSRVDSPAALGATEPSAAESAVRLRAIFDHTYQFIGLLNPTGEVLEANRSALEFAGLSRDQVIGRPFWETAWWPESAEVRSRLRSAIGRAVAGEFVRYETQVLGVAGKSATIDFSLNPVRDAAGAVTMLVAEGRDIEDARRAERELRISQDKHEGIVSTSADAIITMDESQRITDFNRGAEAIFGWPAADVIGKRLDLLLPERFRSAHGEHVRRFGESPETARRMGERRVIAGLRRNGEEFPADASISKLDLGGRRLFTVVLRDITALKRAEAVQAFLARAGGLLAASLDIPTVYASVAQLAVEFLADCCEIFEGESAESVIRVAVAASDDTREAELAKTCAFGVSPDSRHPVWTALETGEPELLEVLDGPALAARAAGELRLFEALPVRSAMIVPLRPRGRTTGAIGFYSHRPHRFGTEDLALARELAARAALAVDNARLYQAARDAVRARDDVLAVVSHDLGNPLSAIRIGVSLLLRTHEAGGDEGGGWEHLAGIKQSVEQMERLIRDLLDVKRIEAGQLPLARKRVRPASLIDSVVEMMAPLAENRGIEIRTHVVRPLPTIEADPERVVQALVN
ncbi:MAG: PAS domain S-box protein, partial [Gemmatimonadota bacterium]